MTHAIPFLEPSDVQHLTVVGMTTVSAYLKWSKPEGNREFYSVTFMNDSNPAEKDCDKEECNITGLIPGTKYEFTVKAVVNKTFGGVASSVSDYTSKYRKMLHCIHPFEPYVSIQSWKFYFCTKLEYRIKHFQIKHHF